MEGVKRHEDAALRRVLLTVGAVLIATAVALSVLFIVRSHTSSTNPGPSIQAAAASGQDVGPAVRHAGHPY